MNSATVPPAKIPMSTANPNPNDKLMNWVAERDLRATMEHERNERVVTEKYRGAFIVMSLVAIFQIGVLLFVSRWTPIPGLASPPAAAAATTPSRILDASTAITITQYDELETGTSYVDACRVLGMSGQELARCSFPGAPGAMEPIETIVYGWINANGSSVNATFQNDRLIAKGQLRLQGAAEE